jgi:c-di-GMP-binding flagellar brake protein YcgR
MVPEEERRTYPRAEIRWPVTIESGRGTIEAKLRNLGVGGAYIHCEEAAEPGERISLTIRPPEASAFKIIAEVIWAGKVLALGMGVRFLEISDEDRQFIADIVSQLLNSTNLK